MAKMLNFCHFGIIKILLQVFRENVQILGASQKEYHLGSKKEFLVLNFSIA
jgi:hypothetical protein